MVRCFVKNCKNYRTKKFCDVKYFRIPKDLMIRRKWINVCELPKSMNINDARVCSSHFLESDYKLQHIVLNVENKKKRLKENAVPTQNVPNEIKISDRQKRFHKKVQKQLVEEAISSYEKNTYVMDRKLNKVEILQLISFYRENEVLWNINSSIYKRMDLKKKALENISIEMKLNVEVLKQKIENLRSAYIIEKIKVDNSCKSGCDVKAGYESPLFWYDEMQFLDNTIILETSKNNVNEKNINQDSDFEITENTNTFSSDSTLSHKISRVDSESSNDEPLNKIISLNQKSENTFEIFEESVASRLKKLPSEGSFKAKGTRKMLAKSSLSSLPKIRNISPTPKFTILSSKIIAPPVRLEASTPIPPPNTSCLIDKLEMEIFESEIYSD